jgi:hypothetical protein
MRENPGVHGLNLAPHVFVDTEKSRTTYFKEGERDGF